MAKLFEASTINGMQLRNRFVRSATWEGMAEEDGAVTPKLIELMVQLARGGVGLIISGHAYVSREGQAGPRQLGVYSDSLVPGLSRMAEAVHEGGGRIVLQLAHAGCHAASALSGVQPLGPSARSAEPDPDHGCREMSPQDLEQTIAAFAAAALRAKRAGFDGVQIHAAHGYLLSQFLSPFYNKRTDRFGGSLENRSRLVLEVLRTIREAVGKDYPVLIKMNSQDFLEGGLTVDEMLRVAGALQRGGIDAIELSGGTSYSGKCIPVRKGKIESPDQEVFYREEARRYRQQVQTPLILVGGVRSLEVAEQLVDTGLTDFVALSRPLIREPALVSRWQSGDTRRSPCLSDNLCFGPALKGKGMYCVTEEKQRAK